MDPATCLINLDGTLMGAYFQPENLEEAVYHFEDYRSWRMRGGYEPRALGQTGDSLFETLRKRFIHLGGDPEEVPPLELEES